MHAGKLVSGIAASLFGKFVLNAFWVTYYSGRDEEYVKNVTD